MIRQKNRTRRTTSALRPSSEEEGKALLNVVFEDSLIGMALLDLEGRWRRVNPALCKLLGYSPEELIGNGYAVITHPDDRAPCAEYLARVVDDSSCAEVYEKRYLHRDGATVWVLVRASAVRDSLGAPSYIVAQIQNDSARKTAETNLTGTETRFRALFDHSRDGIGVSCAGKMVYANVALARMFGIPSPDRMVGMPLGHLVSPAEAERIALNNRRREAGEGVPNLYQSIARRLDGTTFYIEGSISAYEHDGRVYTTAVVRDVTERIAAEERLRALTSDLRRSNDALQEFASIASHDLKEPLRKIRTFGDMLRKRAGVSLDADSASYLGRMLSATQRMQALLDGLLLYSRATSKAPRREFLHLAPIVREAAAELASVIQSGGGEIDIGELPTLLVEPAQMRHLFHELIANACKFRRRDTPLRIEIKAEQTEASATIVFSDNGQGFEGRFAERIFGIFERLEASDGDGTGVGLAICQKIVHLHGGAITASGIPGAGATFTIVLPRAVSATAE